MRRGNPSAHRPIVNDDTSIRYTNDDKCFLTYIKCRGRKLKLYLPKLVCVIMVLLTIFCVFLLFLRAHGSSEIPTIAKILQKDSKVKWFYDHELDYVETNKPLIIAHRGFSGVLPEHTVEAYKMAVDFGADVIECDAALTKDLAVVCFHECWLNETTDVANKFSIDRVSEYFIPSYNQSVKDYFSIDFTLEELKTLRKVEGHKFRNPNNNGKFQISTLEEMIEVAKNSKRAIGLHVEIKDPTFFNTKVSKLKETNKTIEDIVVELLHRKGYIGKRSPCFIQSFDEESLKYISGISQLPLVLLLDYPGDVSEARLKNISEYAYGIGPDKRHFVEVDEKTKTIIKRSPDLIKRCRDLKLRIHAYTFRNEFRFLPWDYHQDPYNELMEFFRLGIDGYFTDFSETAFNFMNYVYPLKSLANFPDVNLVNVAVLLCLLMSCIFNFCF